MATQTRDIIPAKFNGLIGSLLPFLLAWMFVTILAVLAVRALHAPEPEPSTAPENQFSAERALVHVREIARVPHPMGSGANDGVKNYLLAQLVYLGMEHQVFSSMGVRATAHSVIAGQTNDVVGRLAGSERGPAIVLMAHYDSVSRAPGAADDGSGVSSILEVVRALRHNPPLKRDLIVLFTDGEEVGLLGAEAFAHSHPWMNDVGLIMNFEARGNRGPSLLFETSENNQALIEAVDHFAPHPVASSLFYELYKLLPNDTDFTIFRPLGIPGLNFAFGEGLQAYHSQLDTPGNLSLASLQHHGSYGLALTHHFGDMDLTELKASHNDDVFFDWFGSNLVAYSRRWVLPGEALVTGLLGLAVLLMIRRSRVRMGKLFLALLACFVFLVMIPLLSAVGWWILTFFFSGRMIFSDCPANLLLLCGLMFLGTCTGTLLIKGLGRYFATTELSLAGLAIWWVLSWLLALWLPSGSYIIFWPLLLASIGIVVFELVNKGPELRMEWIGNLVAVAATILLFAPLVYLLYIFLTFQLVSVTASQLLLALFLLISLPFMNTTVAARCRWRVVILAAAAVACLVAGVMLSHYTTKYPEFDTIEYSLNADENKAAWISYDERPDSWTRQFLTETRLHPVPNYLAGSPWPVLSATAPVVQLPAPVIENVDDKKERDVHELKLTLRSRRNADVLYLRFENDVQPISVRLAGRDISLHTTGQFSLTLFGMGEKGAELDIIVRAPSSVSFWVMDGSSGLPVDIQPRPNNVMGADGSDMTFVCRKYTL